MKKRKNIRYVDRRIYQSENYLDIQIFPAFAKACKRGKKRRPTGEMQKKLNENNSTYKLIRLANHNFKKGDYAVHLTYDDFHLPQDEESARRDIQNFIRRIKRICAKKDVVLKYIWTAAKGKKLGRIHFHMIMSRGISDEEIQTAWGKGYAHTTYLRFAKDGIAGFSKYFKQQNKMLYRAWSASKNLERPENEDLKIKTDDVIGFFEEYTNSYKHPVLEQYYPGYEVVSMYADKNDIVGGIYIMARLCRVKGKYCDENEEAEQISLFDLWDT